MLPLLTSPLPFMSGSRLQLIVIYKGRFLAYARDFCGGGTQTKKQATLKHKEGYFLCFNIAGVVQARVDH